MRYWVAIVCGWLTGFGIWATLGHTPFPAPLLLGPVGAVVISLVVYKALR